MSDASLQPNIIHEAVPVLDRPVRKHKRDKAPRAGQTAAGGAGAPPTGGDNDPERGPSKKRWPVVAGLGGVATALVAVIAVNVLPNKSGTKVEAKGSTATSVPAKPGSSASTAPNTAPSIPAKSGEIVMMPPLIVEGKTINRLAPSTNFLDLFTSSDDPADIMRSFELVREFTLNYGETLDDQLGGGRNADPTLWTTPFKFLYRDYGSAVTPEVRAEWQELIDKTAAYRYSYDPDHYRDTVIDSILSVNKVSDTEMYLTVEDHESVAYMGTFDAGASGKVLFHWVKEKPPAVAGYELDKAVWRIDSSEAA